MSRQLATATLDAAALDYAACFLGDRGRRDAGFVIAEFERFTYRDEYQYMIDAVRKELGGAAKRRFDLAINTLGRDKPRKDAVFDAELAARLAIDPAGGHIGNTIGKVEIGRRFIALRPITVEPPWSVRRRRHLRLDAGHRETVVTMAPLYWPIYAGEAEERAADSGVADPLPDGTPGLPVGAFVPQISNAVAIVAVDGIVDALDGGTGAAVIQGREGAQPAGVDAAATGTLGFTLVNSDPAFGNAIDDTGKATATASAITDDASADATITLGYCRSSSSNDGATPLADVFQGEAGTATADFIFPSLSIVSGAVISMSSETVSLTEG